MIYDFEYCMRNMKPFLKCENSLKVIAAFSQHSSEAMKTQSLFCWTLLLSAIIANEIQYGTKDHQELASQHPTTDTVLYGP